MTEDAAPVDSLIAWVRSIPDHPPTTAEQLDLARRYAAGDYAAKDELVERNLRLVYWVAQRYMWAGVPIMDLIQEGAIGLMRAVEKFDPERGFAFSTYATHWVRQAVQRAVYNHCRVVRVPIHIHAQLTTMRKVRERLERQTGRPPEPADLAEAMELPLSKIRILMTAEQTETSLDAQMTDADGTTTFADMLEDTAPELDEETETLRQHELIVAALERLPEKQRLVIEMRYGFDGGGNGMTLEEVGRVIGVTRERVRQIQDAAMERLRTDAPELREAIAA